MSSSITEATTKVHALLEPLTPEERRRVVQAVLTLLGDDVSIRVPSAASGTGESQVEEGDAIAKLPPKAKAWVKKNGLTIEQLEHFFHFDNGSVTCIELAGNGKSKKDKTINSYLLMGVAALLSKGEAEFTDAEARQLCEHFGCYDSPNHATFCKAFGNNITGSKSNGWKLTAPGLTAAADLVKL